MEVVLAKPQTDKKSEGIYPYGGGVHGGHLPQAGYAGFAGAAPYSSVGAGYGVAGGFQQVLEHIITPSFLFDTIP